MPGRLEPQPSTRHWHGIGVTAFLAMLVLYAAAGLHVDGPAVDPRLYWTLAVAALLAGLATAVGCLRGWQRRRKVLIAWPVASLLATTAVGLVDPDATKSLPGTITITFAYLGLTAGRWRSFVLLPLGVAAFVIGGVKPLPDALPTVFLAAVMWVLVAEVPAWLIARLEEQSALLDRIAQTDGLTQLLDRRALGSRLSEHATHSAVVFIDLDNFKQYNDRNGHDAGDALLLAFAETLRSSIREQDLAFRIGGDEFLLMLLDADQTQAQRTLDVVRGRWTEAGSPVAFSAGIAAGEQNLIRIADERMYAEKRARGLTAE